MIQVRKYSIFAVVVLLTVSGVWLSSVIPAAHATSGIVTVVPVTITNNQPTPTPSPFQEMLTLNLSLYSASVASDVGNIRFCADSSCNTQLFAWLESCNPECGVPTASATVWVRLPSSIAGSGGTLTIYMGFFSTATEFDGIFWGEAPQLSPAYGQFDNGASVFQAYDNFAGTALPLGWTESVSGGGSVSVNNGLSVSTSGSTVSGAVAQSNIAASNAINEGLVSSFSNGGNSQVMAMVTATNASISGANLVGYQPDSVGWQNTSPLEVENNNGGTPSVVATSTINPSTPFVLGVYSNTLYVNYGIGATTSGRILGNGTIAVEANSGTTTPAVRYSWMRARVYPPNGVMPSANFSSPVPVAPQVSCHQSAGAESLMLPSGSSEYFFVGSTAGGRPMNNVSWTSDVNVVAAYSGNLAITIGHSLSSIGAYSSSAGNHGIAGVCMTGFQGYRNYSSYTPNGTSINLQFTTTPSDTFVVILVGGEGTGNITLSGFSIQTLERSTFSETGGGVIASVAVFSGSLSPGNYTASITSATNPANSGTSVGAVAYVFGSGPIPASGSPLVGRVCIAPGRTSDCPQTLPHIAADSTGHLSVSVNILGSAPFNAYGITLHWDSGTLNATGADLNSSILPGPFATECLNGGGLNCGAGDGPGVAHIGVIANTTGTPASGHLFEVSFAGPPGTTLPIGFANTCSLVSIKPGRMAPSSAPGTNICMVVANVTNSTTTPVPEGIQSQSLGVHLPTPLASVTPGGNITGTLSSGGAPNYATTFVMPYSITLPGNITAWKAQFIGLSAPTGLQIKVLRRISPTLLSVVEVGPIHDPTPVLVARLPSYPNVLTEWTVMPIYTDSLLTVQPGDYIGLTITANSTLGGFSYPLTNATGTRFVTRNVPFNGTIDLSDPFTGTLNGTAPALEVSIQPSPPSLDTTGDGIPDFVALSPEMQALGVDPCRITVLVQLDYMVPANGTYTHKPLQAALDIVRSAFDSAPVSAATSCPYTGFPKKTSGINLIFDVRNSIPQQDALNFTDSQPQSFDTIKAAYFDPNRVRYFHYGLFINDITSGSSISGVAETFGSNFIVSLGEWSNHTGTAYEQAGTLMHELGHNLGLEHGGGDSTNFKPNYLSVMSYAHQVVGIISKTPSGDVVRFDFSGVALPTLNEANLDEWTPLSNSNDYTSWICPDQTTKTALVSSVLDWNCDGVIETSVSSLINKGGTLLGNLTGYNDWANLRYKFTDSTNFNTGCRIGCDIGCRIGCDIGCRIGCDFGVELDYPTAQKIEAQTAAFLATPQRTSSTSISCQPSTVSDGTAAICTVTVTDINTGNSTTPTGTISFLASQPGSFTPANVCILTGTGASVTCSVAFTPGAAAIGALTISAGYPGDTNHLSSNSSTTITAIAPTSVTTTVYDASTNTPWSGAETTGAQAYDAATLTAGSATPTGSLYYTFWTNGFCSGTPSTTQTVTLSPSGKVPNSTLTAPLGAGSYGFQAAYSGDPNYSLSTSGCEPLTVGKATPTIASSANPSSIPIGGSGVDSTSVSGISRYSPTGSVRYTVYSDSICSIQVFTDTEALGTPSTPFTPVATGTYQWIAKYLGDSNYNSVSTSCGAEPLQVTDFTVAASPTDVNPPIGVLTGSSTIMVSALNGFTGTVTLTITSSAGLTCSIAPSSVSLNSTFTSTSSTLFCIATGSGTYTAIVNGTSPGYPNEPSHVAHVTFTFISQTFSINASPNYFVGYTQKGRNWFLSIITVKSLGGFSGNVTLSTNSSPSSRVQLFILPSRVSVTSGGLARSFLLFFIGPNATPGTYTITVTGTSGSITKTATITAIIPDKTVQINSLTWTHTLGVSASGGLQTWTASVTNTGSTVQYVQLRANGIDFGAMHSFTAQSTTVLVPASSTVTLTFSTAAGTFTSADIGRTSFFQVAAFFGPTASNLNSASPAVTGSFSVVA